MPLGLARAGRRPEHPDSCRYRVAPFAAEELKLLLQLGKEVQAFRSWAEFEQGVELALSIARQAAGWRRALEKARLHPSGNEREGVGAGRAESGQLV